MTRTRRFLTMGSLGPLLCRTFSDLVWRRPTQPPIRGETGFMESWAVLVPYEPLADPRAHTLR
jgi:hypothetical protein